MTQYHIISQTSESTVVAQYESNAKRSTQYESEAALERAFIEQLQAQAYEYITIHSQSEMVSNLRQQLERLNQYRFTEDEWQRLYTQVIANATEGIPHQTVPVPHQKDLRSPGESVPVRFECSCTRKLFVLWMPTP